MRLSDLSQRAYNKLQYIHDLSAEDRAFWTAEMNAHDAKLQEMEGKEVGNG